MAECNIKQSNEIETLLCIIAEDFKLLPKSQWTTDDKSKKYTNIFDIKCVPHPGEDSKNHCYITLRVKFTILYPDENVVLQLIDPHKINKTQLKILEQSVNKTAEMEVGNEVYIQIY